jgi:hypothetical protein
VIAEDRRTQWFVMLFPRRRGPDRCLLEMAKLTGGEATPDPHVTLAYLRVATLAESRLERLRALAGPIGPIRAAGPFSFTETAHPLFGYTLSLRVEQSAALVWWRDAVKEALLGEMPLAPGDEWVDGGHHLQAVRQMSMPPTEALSRLHGREWQFAFEATTLIVSQRIGDTFPERLVHHWGD